MAQTLRLIRQEQEMLLREVADSLGVDTTTVWSWETGRYEPSLKHIKALAELYKKPLIEVVEAAMTPLAKPPHRKRRSA